MTRLYLILIGGLLLILQLAMPHMVVKYQFILFLAGIIFLGIPHGAADLLISLKFTSDKKARFSYLQFFLNYLGRLLFFLAILLLSPAIGVILFIILASFHFGETDLYQFETDTITGKLFSVSYGLIILSIILLFHFNEVKPLLMEFDAGKKFGGIINWIDTYKITLLFLALIQFYVFTFIYFISNKNNPKLDGTFLVNFLLIILILFCLPMLLGFTFYFVFWHSIISLQNITRYLRHDLQFSMKRLITQISIYSIMAVIGVVIFGVFGAMFLNSNTIIIYALMGLAVLTAPHMQIMHTMYHNIRLMDVSLNETAVQN